MKKKSIKKEEFNGYAFDDSKMAKRMKYLVVFAGDLDLNGCYAFANKKDLREYMKDNYRDVSVFKVDYIGRFRTKIYDTPQRNRPAINPKVKNNPITKRWKRT